MYLVILSISFVSEAPNSEFKFARQDGVASDPGDALFTDDFNRVILSMKRGQEYTDYINASFIDVSAGPPPSLRAWRDDSSLPL